MSSIFLVPNVTTGSQEYEATPVAGFVFNFVLTTFRVLYDGISILKKVLTIGKFNGTGRKNDFKNLIPFSCYSISKTVSFWGRLSFLMYHQVHLGRPAGCQSRLELSRTASPWTSTLFLWTLASACLLSETTYRDDGQKIKSIIPKNQNCWSL